MADFNLDDASTKLAETRTPADALQLLMSVPPCERIAVMQQGVEKFNNSNIDSYPYQLYLHQSEGHIDATLEIVQQRNIIPVLTIEIPGECTTAK